MRLELDTYSQHHQGSATAPHGAVSGAKLRRTTIYGRNLPNDHLDADPRPGTTLQASCNCLHVMKNWDSARKLAGENTCHGSCGKENALFGRVDALF